MNWDQLKTILWLRWRLTRNQWSRSGGLGAVIAVLAGVSAIVMGGLCFAGALLGGAFGLAEVSPTVIMWIWFGLTAGFLLFWMIGLLAELQRSETIDLQRLMHLPVALGQMFIINYIVSHFTVSIIVAVPAMMGLAIGLAMARGPEMALLLPLALSMVFMITAWTYCLRGWLATLMSNPRRRRTVIMGITFTLILLGQGPNLYFNVINRQDHHSNQPSPVGREKLNQLIAAQKFIPPFWLPFGAQELANGNVFPALLGTLGCLGLGALGLRRAYRGTMRFYYGETGGKVTVRTKPAVAVPATAASAENGNRFLEWRLPAVPEQAAALALATFRSLLRAPEVKMAFGSAFLSMVFVGGMVFFRSPPHLSDAAKPFIATGVVAFSIFLFIQFLANQFGLDRDGFRSLILSPADRRLILLGKNLASLPVCAIFGIFLLTLATVWLHLPGLVFVATLLQFAAMLLLAGLAGNLLSILVPYRIQSGSMKPTKMPGLVMLVMMLCQMLFPIAMAPAFAPPLAEKLWQLAGWPEGVPVNLLLSALLAALAAVAYWQTLGPLGRLLQHRETKILGVVTVEVE
jgi:hypothetical protein